MLATFALLMAAAVGPDCAGAYAADPVTPCFWAEGLAGNDTGSSHLIVPGLDQRNGV